MVLLRAMPVVTPAPCRDSCAPLMSRAWVLGIICTKVGAEGPDLWNEAQGCRGHSDAFEVL